MNNTKTVVDALLKEVQVFRKSTQPKICKVCGKPHNDNEQCVVFEDNCICTSHQDVIKELETGDAVEIMKFYPSNKEMVFNHMQTVEFEMAKEFIGEELAKLVEPAFSELEGIDRPLWGEPCNMANFYKLWDSLKEEYSEEAVAIWNLLMPEYQMRDDHGIILPDSGTILIPNTKGKENV